jgi:micrococcal nuclease
MVTEVTYLYNAVVTSIYDGDTIRVNIDLGFNFWKMNETIRLSGIDAPELRGIERPLGLKSKEWLEKKIPIGSKIIIQTEKDKQEKYGITKEDFTRYNKSRATTLENLIHRYGEEEGAKKWDEYCKIQSYAGSSLKYFEEKFGEEEGVRKWVEINYLKSHNKDVFIKKYGEEDGIRRWNEYIQRKPSYYSQISQKLFW